MYEQQLEKLAVPVDLCRKKVFVPSYHEQYPLQVNSDKWDIIVYIVNSKSAVFFIYGYVDN